MKTIFKIMSMLLAFSALTMASCGDEKDEPDMEEEGTEISGTNYDPNSDHALAMCLKQKGYGSLTTNVNYESALIGSWEVVSICSLYWEYLEYNKGCQDDWYGFRFDSDGMAYYIDESGNVEGNGHSWHVEDGDHLKVFWRGTNNDRYTMQYTTKGYLILTTHGSSCWKVLQKK